MATPPDWVPGLSGLSAASSPQEARQFIESGLGHGLSLNATLAAVRGGGLTISNATARQFAREYYASVSSAEVLAHTPFAFVPSEAAFPERQARRNFGNVVMGTAFGINPDTGESATFNVSLTYQGRLTRSQLNTLLLQNLSHVISESGFRIRTSDITYVSTHRNVPRNAP